MFLERLVMSGLETSQYYQSEKFNKSVHNQLMLPNCTDYCVCRTYEACQVDEPFLMFNGKAIGGYPIAKEFYRTTCLPKGNELKVGAIGVFDGTGDGHVVYVERAYDKTHGLLSESNFSDNKNLRDWHYFNIRDNQELVIGKATIKGVGALLGFIYTPIKDVRTIRDLYHEQIEITDTMVNVRKEPKGELVCEGCYAPMGVYNVLDKKQVDGYIWFKIDSDCWVRDGEWIVYFPTQDIDSEYKAKYEDLRTKYDLYVEEVKKVKNKTINELERL